MSGRALLVLQNAGMAEMSPVFSRFIRFKVNGYRKDWCNIRTFWTTEKWVRVMDETSAKGIKFVGLNQVQKDPQTGLPAIDPQTMRPKITNNVAEMDVDIIVDEGAVTVTTNEELLDVVKGRADVPLELLIELSNHRNKDFLLDKLKQYKAPPPEQVQMQQQMQQLEARTKALEADKLQSEIDKNVATTEKTRADAMLVLEQAMVTPQQEAATFPLHFTGGQGADAFGGPPMGQPPQGPPMGPGGPPPPGMGPPPGAPPMGHPMPTPPGLEPPPPPINMDGVGYPHVGDPGTLPMPAPTDGMQGLLTDRMQR